MESWVMIAGIIILIAAPITLAGIGLAWLANKFIDWMMK
jgi:hypothetical protein